MLMLIQRLRQREARSSFEVSAAHGGLSLLAQRVLSVRGLSGPASTLTLDNLIPPDALKGVQAAADLLFETLKSGRRILIVGDYDVDGATATAMMVDCLRRHYGADVDYFIPNRFVHGYGLSTAIVRDIAAQPDELPALLITVDNGIASADGILAAQALGMRVLVTDHHLPGTQACPADAVVNPNQEECDFPSKSACGCTVAFYLLTVLRRVSADWVADQGWTAVRMGDYLDLVALATVADVVPLDGNNRILVEQGLRRVRSGYARPGILALLQAAGRDHRQITSQDFGFVIGPRLNAAGRMDDMTVGVACLLATDAGEAGELAAILEDHNQARKHVQNKMVEQATDQMLQGAEHLGQESDDQSALVLWDTAWHEGVVGLVAGRLKERWHKPVLALCPGSSEEVGVEVFKGSARSIPGVHIRDVLAWVDARYPGMIVRFGGHAMAAGLTVHSDQLDALRSALQEAMQALVDPDVLVPELVVDGELNASDMTLARAEELSTLGPWGQGCPVPLFVNRFQVINHRWLGGKHLKLQVQLEAGSDPVDAIWFFCPLPADTLPSQQIILAYELAVNEFRGARSLQLMVRTELTPSVFESAF
ncbi:single-stranded-DNA-specific exonuclease RecJ [Salinispirillum sp. LH 10-3-1]|uniref:Single-stranded-DNA-specific exonuclease RecJ n=1 Tax=Salinispirillum sp. LH 10-3-1 TaxID=2952525 RepID=A0AB38YDG5_9GAMM